MSYSQYSQKKQKKKAEENKGSALHNLKELEHTGVFDISFFTKPPNSNKIPISQETLAQAFRIIDPYNNRPHGHHESSISGVSNKSPHEMTMRPEDFGRYKMNFAEMKRRIQIINPTFPVNELALFTGGKPEIMFKELYELLQDNEITDDLDPLNEAVELLLDKEGNLDLDRLKTTSQALGYPPLEKKDLEILKECIDIDGDGKISKNDFSDLFKFMHQRKKSG